MEDIVKGQYEAYPYPARRCDEEESLDSFGPLEELEVLNHFVWGGARDWTKPFRVLVAGGGTGDASTALAKQMQDRGIPGEVVYVDLSTASRETAHSRAKAVGLNNIAFHTGSLLDVASMDLGLFDYINCSGVLHHLEEPEAGSKALASVMAPGGALGVMVYGELGRIGVYHAQDMLRMLCGSDAMDKQVEVARRLLPSLPHSNWLVKNNEQQFKHELDDIEIVDRFLHTCDQAYRVNGCVNLVKAAGLTISEFVPPLLYKPDFFVADPVVMERVKGMDKISQYAFTELCTGFISKQSFFAVRAEDEHPQPLNLKKPGAVPELLSVRGGSLANRVQETGKLGLSLGAVHLEQALDLTPARESFLRSIDGVRNLFAICSEHVGANPNAEQYASFITEISPLYELLNGTTGLVLHQPI